MLKTKKTDLNNFFSKQKSSELNSEEKTILEERIKYAKIYLEKYSAENKVTVNNKQEQNELNASQKSFLKLLSSNLQNKKEDVQMVVFDSIKESKLNPRDAFKAFYLTLTGIPFGPKAGDLIKEFGVSKVIELLRSLDNKEKKAEKHLFPTLDKPDIFSIDPVMAEKYPSINIGIAIIKDVNIQKNNPELQKEIDEFINSFTPRSFSEVGQNSLNNELISSYPEILSYRKLYKQMGLDWHSKRPSPEALLRRIALKKGLYNVNTCVDAYNLIVMKHHVSIGAFDYDRIKFPTILRFPKFGEEILLLGDEQPTKYKPTDLAYFDQMGGYNIYFNYRDAQRTAVQIETKNIILNIDGVYDISRGQVEKSLQESIDIITKYCGGKVEAAGIVSA